MITKRIIPCLDVKNGRVVKGVNFLNLADVSSPVSLACYYSENGADELVFYDITASAEGRALFTDVLKEVASTIFIPLTVGGGINTVDDFDRVLKCGADKVSVNSGAIRNPKLIEEAAKKYGDQCVVISADVRRVDGVFRVFAKGGRETQAWKLSSGSAAALAWAQVRSCSIPWTPTVSSRALTLRCWTRSVKPSRFPSSLRAARDVLTILPSCFNRSPVSTRGLPPRSSISARSPSRI